MVRLVNYLWGIIISLNLSNLWFFWMYRLLLLLSVSLNLDSTWFDSAALVCWFVLIDFSGARLTWRLHLRSLLAPLNIDRGWCFCWLLGFFLWCLGWCRSNHLPSRSVTTGTSRLLDSCSTLRTTILLGRLPLFLLTFLIAFSSLLLLLFDSGIDIVVWAAAAAALIATFFIAVMCWMGWWLKLRWSLWGEFGRFSWKGIRLVFDKLVTRFH